MTSQKKIIKVIKDPIKEEMKEFEHFFSSALNSRIHLLNLINKYIIKRKGKEMRPMLVFLVAKLVGDVKESTYTGAALIQMLHTATLIHDDVVDEAYERRGFFSINALWKSKVAVLVGDFLLSKGLLLAIDHNEFDQLKVVSQAVREMSEGELLQIEKSRKLDINEEVYLDIIYKKTASLIASCTWLGALSAGADEKTCLKMKRFGELLGIAFQIKDDLFDYQKQGNIGKPTGNDIKERKMTLPLISVLHKASSGERRKIMRTIKRHNKDSKKVNQLIQYVREHGGLDYTENKMLEYRDQALDILNEFPCSNTREALNALVIYTTTRNK